MKPDRFDILIALLVVGEFLIVAALPIGPKRFGDDDFHLEARTLAQRIRGEVSWEEVAVTKAPAPVFYYAIPYLAVPANADDDTYWRWAVVWSAVWMIVALLVLRRAARMLGGERAGYLAPLLLLATPFVAYYSFGVLAEPPALLGSVLLIYGWAQFRARETDMVRFGSPFISIGLVLLLLSRPNTIVLLPLMVVLAIVYRMRSDTPGKRMARVLFVNVAGSTAICAAVLVVASLLPGRADEERQGSYLSHVLFQSRFQYRTELWDWRSWEDTQKHGSVDYAAYVSQYRALRRQAVEEDVPIAAVQRAWIVSDWLQYPGITIRAALVRMISLHVPRIRSVDADSFQVGPFKGRVLYFVIHGFIYLIDALVLGLAGFFAFRKRAQLRVLWVLWAPWLALVIFHALTFSEPRYMFPSRPGLAVLASLGAALLLKGGAAERDMQKRPDLSPEEQQLPDRTLRARHAV